MVENTCVFPGDASRGEIQIEQQRLVWENEAARLYVDRVRFPARENCRPIVGEQFRLAHAAGKADGGVVAPVADDHRIVLVRQFRHPVRMRARELPRGGREARESAEDAAPRAAGETGFELADLIPLGRVANDTGQLEEMPNLFVARDTNGRGPAGSDGDDRPAVPLPILGAQASVPDGRDWRRDDDRGRAALEPLFEDDHFLGGHEAGLR